MHIEKQLHDLSVAQEVRDIALWVLNLLHIRGLFVDDPNYDGQAGAVFASEMCLWFYACPLIPVDDRYQIELRLNRSEVVIEIQDMRQQLLVCFKYSSRGKWIAYSREEDASKRFVDQIKSWHKESRDKDLDPLIAVCAECEALSPVALGVIRSVIENAR